MTAALQHADGLKRCAWPGVDPLYVAYHDTEWGVPEYDDRALFEKVVRYTPNKVERLMADAGIVRNRMKIEGTILSARAWLTAMERGPGFSKLLWDFVDGRPQINRRRTHKQMPTENEAS